MAHSSLNNAADDQSQPLAQSSIGTDDPARAKPKAEQQLLTTHTISEEPIAHPTNAPVSDDEVVEEDVFDENISPLEAVLTQNTETTVRWTMTAAASLFGVAAFLTVLVASNYRFFLACVWVMLGFMFVGFVWFVQQTILCAKSQSPRRVFHPAVHAVADWVIREVQHFADDFRDEYLQLIDEKAAYDSYNDNGYVAEPTVPQTQQQQQRKPKSKLFRAIVKPLMHLALGGGRRKRRKEKKKQQQAEESSKSAYVPPATTTTTTTAPDRDRDIV